MSCKPTNDKPLVQHPDKPNVVFISIDDLRPELGCYGNPIIMTPNINKLAAEGHVFKRHYVQVPTCGASRYSLLTGFRPKAKIYLNNNIFETEVANKKEQDRPESFIHHLRRQGYHTVGIGKISHSADGLVYGYEEEVSTKRELPYSWDELLFNSGKWETGWNAFFGYASGENRQILNRQVKPYEAAEVDDLGYPDGLIAKAAVEKLKHLADLNQPFFLGVGFFKPHLPFNAPKQYWDIYQRESMPLAPDSFISKDINSASLHNSGEFNGYKLGDEMASLNKAVSDEYAKKLIHAYYAAVSYIDAQVGLVIKEIESLNLSDNTIVVIWGDHGWHLGNDRVWGKHTLFETALKSALIIKVPGGITGTSDAIVETVDLYPTILELCQIELHHEVDGDSFAGILKDNIKLKDDVAYSYFKNGISMRTDRYRLTKYYRTAEPTIELYDHHNDPYESENIAPNNIELLEKLLPILEKGNTGLYL